LIARGVEALGGERAITRWDTGKIRYRTSGNILAELPADMDVQIEEVFQLPGQFKRVVRATGKEKLVIVYVINGDQGWSRFGDGPVLPIPQAANHDLHDFVRFFGLPASPPGDARYSLLGEQLVNGRPTEGVRMEAGEAGTFDLYFDTERGLLVKKNATVSDPKDGRQVRCEVYLDEYKDVQGGKVPMKMQSRIGSRTIGITILDVEFVDDIDEKEFAKP